MSDRVKCLPTEKLEAMSLKYVWFVGALLFSIYTGIQSYAIASAGVTYQVQQLEGDGGAGLAFTSLCAVAAVIALFWPRVGALAFFCTGLVTGFAGLAYGDNIDFFWILGPVLFMVGALVSYKSLKYHVKTLSAKNQTTKQTRHSQSAATPISRTP